MRAKIKAQNKFRDSISSLKMIGKVLELIGVLFFGEKKSIY